MVLAGVTDADLDRPTPCAGWDVRQLLEHVVAGNWLSAGRADERFDTGCAADFVTSYAASVEPARQAFDAPGALEREFPVRRRTIPGPTFVALRTIDLLVHAWDLARATGQPTDLDADVVAHCDAFVATVMTPEFRGRHFGPARPAPARRHRCRSPRGVARTRRDLIDGPLDPPRRPGPVPRRRRGPPAPGAGRSTGGGRRRRRPDQVTPGRGDRVRTRPGRSGSHPACRSGPRCADAPRPSSSLPTSRRTRRRRPS